MGCEPAALREAERDKYIYWVAEVTPVALAMIHRAAHARAAPTTCDVGPCIGPFCLPVSPRWGDGMDTRGAAAGKRKKEQAASACVRACVRRDRDANRDCLSGEAGGEKGEERTKRGREEERCGLHPKRFCSLCILGGEHAGSEHAGVGGEICVGRVELRLGLLYSIAFVSRRYVCSFGGGGNNLVGRTWDGQAVFFSVCHVHACIQGKHSFLAFV